MLCEAHHETRIPIAPIIAPVGIMWNKQQPLTYKAVDVGVHYTNISEAFAQHMNSLENPNSLYRSHCQELVDTDRVVNVRPNTQLPLNTVLVPQIDFKDPTIEYTPMVNPWLISLAGIPPLLQETNLYAFCCNLNCILLLKKLYLIIFEVNPGNHDLSSVIPPFRYFVYWMLRAMVPAQTISNYLNDIENNGPYQETYQETL